MTLNERERRAKGMLALFRQGKTLQEVGNRYSVTRERVRQILLQYFSIDGAAGGRAVKKELRIGFIEAKRDRLCISFFGMPSKKYRSYPKSIKIAFRQQRQNARNRGVAFSLNFAQFVSIWESSGKLQNRGRGAEKYCMARIGDSGAYEIGNVHIVTNAENARAYAISKFGKPQRPKEEQGACLAYPGAKKPYIAYSKQKRLGCFSTKEEALEARRKHLEAA